MKFLHISDLHIGKTLHQESLLNIQIDALNQVLEHCKSNDINVLVIAGDVYDRSVPSGEAVEVMNQFLNKAIFEYKIKVLMITGNHDSSERMNFVSDILAYNGLHIVSYPTKELKPIVIDGINFYLVPFFKPSSITMMYDEPCSTYQDAFNKYISHQEIDYTKTNVLITHQFIAGNKEVVRSDSEAILSVGGSEIIDVDLVKNFDYVALGHIHACQKIKYEHVRYSGSLLKYSFDEANQVKGMLEVTINNKEVNINRVELKPSIDVCKYKGYFDDFIKGNIEGNKENYIAFELLDTCIVPLAKDRLKELYPNLLTIQYVHLQQTTSNSVTSASVGFEKKAPIELFKEFYEGIKEQPLSNDAFDIIKDIIEGSAQDDTY